MTYVTRKSGGSWKKAIDQKWWDNQKDALALAHRYLKDPGGSRRWFACLLAQAKPA